jgi:steroid delta-isomerase-like uncharacterized protein
VSEQNKRLVHEITAVIWNSRGLDRILEFYAPDFVGETIARIRFAKDTTAVRAMVEGAWTAFPDYHEEVHELIAEGDRVVVHLTISGTQHGQWGPLPATGKRAQFDEIVILQIRDGRVLRQRGIVDNLSALRQLGAVPSPRS